MSAQRKVTRTLALLLCLYSAGAMATMPFHLPSTLTDVFPEDFLEGTSGAGSLFFVDLAVGHQVSLVYLPATSTGDTIMCSPQLRLREHMTYR